jgi:hypothetical protein
VNHATREEPQPVEPEPVVVEPEPVVIEPEPVVVEPEPVVAEPEPDPVTAPEPEPRAVEPEPEPRAVEPEPAPPALLFAGPLESALRHPFLVLLPLLAAVGAAVALGLQRDPVYSTAARINVGRVDVPAYTLQGVTIGNSTLASSYARAITAPAVTKSAARKSGIDLTEAYLGLSASQVPKSTLIEVNAEGTSSARAIRLANAGADALITYVTKLNVRQERTTDLRAYRAASARVQRALVKVQTLTFGNPFKTAALRKQLREARTEFATRQLEANAIGARITQRANAPESKGLLQLVVPASRAESDRDETLEELIIIGVVTGLVLGLAFALLVTNWRYLRSPRH